MLNPNVDRREHCCRSPAMACLIVQTSREVKIWWHLQVWLRYEIHQEAEEACQTLLLLLVLWREVDICSRFSKMIVKYKAVSNCSVTSESSIFTVRSFRRNWLFAKTPSTSSSWWMSSLNNSRSSPLCVRFVCSPYKHGWGTYNREQSTLSSECLICH